jgi:proline iminopeptidase
MKIQEGYMPFKGYQTYYRIVGEENPNKKPLLLLHGGPGSTHNYFEVLDKLADLDNRQLIMYDQIGCGNSFVEGHPELFNAQTWIEELEALRNHLKLDNIHLLGQSWGGMQLLLYVCNYQPQGLNSIILSSTLPSSKMWSDEQHRMIKELPSLMQEAIKEADEKNDYTGQAYELANAEFMKRHATGNLTPENMPEPLKREKKSGSEAYITAWGPNEFTPLGNLKDYDVTKQLKDIKWPTLITSGGNDLSTPYINKYMYDHIPNGRWELFRDAAHMPFVEDVEEYIQLLIEWLNQND